MALTPAAHDPKRSEILKSMRKQEDKDAVNKAWNMDQSKGVPEVQETVGAKTVGEVVEEVTGGKKK